MKTKIVAVKQFVRTHKTKLAVAGTAATGLYLHLQYVGEMNDFLKDHDLFDKYYHPEEN